MQLRPRQLADHVINIEPIPPNRGLRGEPTTVLTYIKPELIEAQKTLAKKHEELGQDPIRGIGESRKKPTR